MALATTTLSAAVLVGDNAISVASSTSMAAGRLIRVDGEVMKVSGAYVSGTLVPVLRGQDGTVTAAHPSGANVVHGLASDFSGPANGSDDSVSYPARPARVVSSYAASGAITLPAAGSDAVAVLIGTSALAMTLANPTSDMDGSILIIVGNGKSASTVTYTAGLGNAGSSYDVVTFQNAGIVSLSLIAVNSFWVSLNTPITGTSTALSVAIA
jgi:hypothetical protein